MQNQEYPWPNDSTTLLGSNQIVSKVTLNDYDQNRFEDAVFVSASSKGDQPIIRVVRSGAFSEQFNIASPPRMPDLKLKMFVTDIDFEGKQEELVYINDKRDRVIAIDLNEVPWQVRFDLQLVNKLEADKDYGFLTSSMGTAKSLEIGENIILFKDGTVKVESSLDAIDGGWSSWNNWYTFPNGTTCSKNCGDGKSFRQRLCNDPEPRNGGAMCSATMVDSQEVMSVHVEACRLRDCTPDECAPNETFNAGSCDAPIGEGEDPYGLGSGSSTGGVNNGGSTGGGTGSGPGGIVTEADCQSNEAFDPFYRKCFRAYTYTGKSLEPRHTVTIWDRSSDGSTYETTIHQYPISVNHPAALGYTPTETARQVCVWKGKQDVVTFKTGTYIAGENGRPLSVYVACNYIYNGGMHRGVNRQCPVGNDAASFGYKGWSFSRGQRVEYLSSVTCR